MSATNTFESNLLTLLFINTQCPDVGDANGLQPSGTPGSFYISLHTASLDDAQTAQTQSEAAYTGYERQAVARSAAGWTVATGTVTNDSAVTYPECTANPETEVDFGIGSAVSGTGNLQIFGALQNSLSVTVGTQPQFAAGALAISID